MSNHGFCVFHNGVFLYHVLARAFSRCISRFLLNTPSGGTLPAPHLAHCGSGQRQADEVELEVEIGSGSDEASQVLGGWFGQAVLHSFSLGVDWEARRHHALDFFDPQADRETKLQNEAANGPELHSFVGSHFGICF